MLCYVMFVVCMYVFMYVCMHVCMLCMYCMYVCLYVCMYMLYVRLKYTCVSIYVYGLWLHALHLFLFLAYMYPHVSNLQDVWRSQNTSKNRSRKCWEFSSIRRPKKGATRWYTIFVNHSSPTCFTSACSLFSWHEL